MFAFLQSLTSKVDINISALTTHVPHISLPDFHFIDYKEDEVNTLISDHPGDPVDLRVLAGLADKTDTEIYLSNHDHIAAINNNNWFSDNVVITSFCLMFSLLGTTSFIVIVFIAIRSKYTFLKGGLFSKGPLPKLTQKDSPPLSTIDCATQNS